MTYSISNSVPFSSINWDTFENRPQANESMPNCEEKDWYADTKCCMDGYSMEHVREVAYDYGLDDTPEVKFLDQYPCLNGPELDRFVDEIESMEPKTTPQEEELEKWPTFECLTKPIFEGLKKVLPQPLLDNIKPYLCKY